MYMTKEEIREAFPDAFIKRDVQIGRGVRIKSGVRIRSGVVIKSGARIGIGAVIESGAVIGRGARIGSIAEIESGAVIGRGAVIGSIAVIGSGAVIGRDRKGVTHALAINGIRTTKRMTAHTSDDGLVIVIGYLNDCRGETIEQARQSIAEEYSSDHAYFVALELAQRWYDQLEYTNTN